jgi:hypothetical protein
VLEGDVPLTIDQEKLRSRLRHQDRGALLRIAERALEALPASKCAAIVGDFLRVEDLAPDGTKPTRSLLEEVREFSRDALAGRYYQSFRVDSRNCMDHSHGTQHFLADFDRIEERIRRASARAKAHETREAYELLFAPLRRIDEGMDDVLFFADEGGSWQVPVDWVRALPVYFRVLARTADAETFARTVDATIADFVHPDRAKYLEVARQVATAPQKQALASLPAPRR